MFTHDFSPLAIAMFLIAGSLKCISRSLRIVTALSLTLFWMFPLYFLLVKWHCLYVMAVVLLAFTWCCVRIAGHNGVETTSELQTVAAG